MLQDLHAECGQLDVVSSGYESAELWRSASRSRMIRWNGDGACAAALGMPIVVRWREVASMYGCRRQPIGLSVLGWRFPRLQSRRIRSGG